MPSTLSKVNGNCNNSEAGLEVIGISQDHAFALFVTITRKNWGISCDWEKLAIIFSTNLFPDKFATRQNYFSLTSFTLKRVKKDYD